MLGRVRLIPIVLVATASLLLLKTAGIVAGSGYTLGGLAGAHAQSASALPPPQPLDGAERAPVASNTPVPASAPAPAARPAAQEPDYPDITGSVGGGAPAPKPAPAKPPGAAPANPRAAGTPVTLDEKPQPSAAERAILERLQERRQELEARARELDMREGLLRAAEKRLEARLDELRQLEKQTGAGGGPKGEEAEANRLKSLVTMYENMKAKEAARIFDRLDMKVLVDVARRINPRRMSEILAQMSPEAAERLTVELAARAPAGGARPPSAADLPKIEGRPRT